MSKKKAVFAPDKCPDYVEPSIVYKTSKAIKSLIASLVMLSGVLPVVGYNLVEDHVRVSGNHIIIDSTMPPLVRNWFCTISSIILLDIEGC